MEWFGLKNKYLSNYIGIDKCIVFFIFFGDKELIKWYKVVLYYFFKYYEVVGF